MKKNGLPYYKNASFKVPEGYFGNLDDRIMERLAAFEDSCSLPGDHAQPFKVPEQYFNSLEDKILQRVEKPRKEPKIISLLNRESFYYVAGVAAVVIAIITNVFQNSESLTFDTLDTLTIENYLEESMNYDSHRVSQMVSEGLFSSATIDQSRYLNQEAVMEYLQEHVEDPSLIFNED